MSVASSLAVMRNAFSTATASAKIPDGAVSASISERSATAGSLSSPAGRLTFVLTPSLVSHLQASTSSPATALEDLAITGHSTDSQVGTPGNVDQWRLVSAGLRLTSINGSDTLNGWFEAVRLTCTMTPAILAAGVLPDGFENNIINSTEWPNHPSYVTGRLRDLGKHTFYLQPIDKSEFQKAGELFDTNFDNVLIRVYSLPSDTASQQTAVHYHIVKNFEICYDAQSPLSRFQTGCPVYIKGVDNVRKGMTRDCKASMIRSASAYAYR
jgi:hypothetical protein